MKASVVVKRVQQLLGDTGTTNKYHVVNDVIPAIATAQREFFTDRPDARMAASHAWPSITDPTAETSDMIIAADYTEPVANLAAFTILTTRARTKLDSAGADKFMARYRELIGA